MIDRWRRQSGDSGKETGRKSAHDATRPGAIMEMARGGGGMEHGGAAVRRRTLCDAEDEEKVLRQYLHAAIVHRGALSVDWSQLGCRHGRR